MSRLVILVILVVFDVVAKRISSPSEHEHVYRRMEDDGIMRDVAGQ
jgi:hypothetical protein